jgi:hypothetical protein
MHALAIATVVLRIVVWPSGMSGDSHTWTLRCGPVGGTLPNAALACRKLSSLSDPFAPTPPDVACTQIYGGPEVARVTGRVNGRAVWATFRRRDGCETDRWNRLAFLFR